MANLHRSGKKRPIWHRLAMAAAGVVLAAGAAASDEAQGPPPPPGSTTLRVLGGHVLLTPIGSSRKRRIVCSNPILVTTGNKATVTTNCTVTQGAMSPAEKAHLAAEVEAAAAYANGGVPGTNEGVLNQILAPVPPSTTCISPSRPGAGC